MYLLPLVERMCPKGTTNRVHHLINNEVIIWVLSRVCTRGSSRQSHVPSVQ
jgi:hypothetical protein